VSHDSLQRRFDREIEKMGVRIKDANQLKLTENVFDEVTLLALYRLVHKKEISAIGGSISTGKEANIFHGQRGEEAVAIKIYRIGSASFKAMSEYITGDPRFTSVRKTRKELVFAWTRKEYSNLSRAWEAGVPVPKPFLFERNILLMEFLGEDETPFPQLRHVEMEAPEEVYETILVQMKRLYDEARLVHADLSEYNILLADEVYFIDMGQSVTLDHPQAFSFLFRDIANINRFFRKKCTTRTDKEIFREVVGPDFLEP
jgi:RIO kinase 1